MDESMVSIDSGRKSNGTACFHQGQSYEEMKQLLACVTMELESTREAAKAQGQLHDARVRHLEELLKTARRERDEAIDQCQQLQGRFLSTSRSMGSVSQESQLRPLSRLPPLESVLKMHEPSRATLSEVHRKLQGQQPQLELQKQLEYVSSMTPPTRDTLTEVHRKFHEQQQFRAHVDVHHQHNGHSQPDLRPASSSSHLEFQSQRHQHQHQHQHQLNELRHHLDIQHKESLQEQLHLDMVMSERQSAEMSLGEVDNGSEAKSSTWSEFSPGVHMEIHSNEQCLILDNPDHVHFGLSQGLPSPHIEPRLEDIQQHLQQQQQEDSMQLHLRQQQGSEQLLAHMQQGKTTDSRSLHLQDEQPLRRQLSQHKDGRSPMSAGMQGSPMSTGLQCSPMATGLQGSPMATGLQGSNGVMDLPSLGPPLQPPSWPVPLIGRQLSNGRTNGQLFQSSLAQGGSVVSSILSPLERFSDGSLIFNHPVHLPEPPESDPQVLLNSLPERGRLLEAVMQSGPLLKTLLVAGQLPQWKHPPPTMDSDDIPRVSMCMSGGLSNLEQAMRQSTPMHSIPTMQSVTSSNGFCH